MPEAFHEFLSGEKEGKITKESDKNKPKCNQIVKKQRSSDLFFLNLSIFAIIK